MWKQSIKLKIVIPFEEILKEKFNINNNYDNISKEKINF